MKTTTVILSGLAALALFASPIAYAQSSPKTALHTTNIVTGGKTVYGALTVEIGEGDVNNCHNTKWLPLETHFSYKDNSTYTLFDSDILRRDDDKQYQCVIEHYKFNHNDVRIAYLLKVNDNGKYVSSEPSSQTVDLK